MATEPAVVVNQAFADKFFPGEDPIGARLGLSWNVDHGVIVGIAANARQTSLAVQPQPTLFLAQAQGPMYFGALVVRTSNEPTAMARAVETPFTPWIRTRRYPDRRPSTASCAIGGPARLAVLLSAFLRGLALLLTSVGLYGVLVLFGVAAHPRNRHPHGLGGKGVRTGGWCCAQRPPLILVGMVAGLATHWHSPGFAGRFFTR